MQPTETERIQVGNQPTIVPLVKIQWAVLVEIMLKRKEIQRSYIVESVHL